MKQQIGLLFNGNSYVCQNGVLASHPVTGVVAGFLVNLAKKKKHLLRAHLNTLPTLGKGYEDLYQHSMGEV